METTVEAGVAAYINEALALLDDLPPDQREELAEGIEEAILEVAAESESDLTETLGAPDEFVRELRSASGIEARGPKRRFASLRDGVDDRIAALADHHSWQWTRQLGRELRPGWWVVRAYAVMVALAAMRDGWRDTAAWIGPIPIPKAVTPTGISLVLVGAAIVASVELGRRSPSRWRTVGTVVVNVIAVSSLFAASMTLQDRLGFATYAEDAAQFVEPLFMARIPVGEEIPVYTFEDLDRLWGIYGSDTMIEAPDGSVFTADSIDELFRNIEETNIYP